MRKKHGKRIDSTKWKFSKGAFRKRYCERCGKKLRKEETMICKGCYHEMMAGAEFNTE
jgi:predicted amidophosphoribosyltransferase